LLPGYVPLLRKKFSEIRFIRNDIMHAHNINKADYSSTRRLFEDANKELDAAIEGLADGSLIPDIYKEDIVHTVYLVADDGFFLTDSEGDRLVATI